MKDMTFGGALREQFRDPDTYWEQAVNVIFGLFRLIGVWVAMTATFTSGAAILSFITTDLSVYTQGELQEGLRVIVMYSGAVAAVACLLGNAGKFRDVFTARAREEVQWFQNAKDRVQSQVETTESLLVQHGLISKADVERRRADSERGNASARETADV